MTAWLVAVQFLTKIPVRLRALPSERQTALAVVFYPLVGVLIGLILAGFTQAVGFLPSVLAAALMVVAWIWLTGGLHLDGLADIADAWLGGWGEKERTLTIMKDPTCGAMGVLALIAGVLIKFAAVHTLLTFGGAALGLMIAPVVGRLVILWLFLRAPYVRKNGIGSPISTHLPKTATAGVLAIGVLLVILSVAFGFGLWAAAWLAGALMAFLWYYRRAWQRLIGGVTGDVIGAAVELGEMLTLLVMAGVLAWQMVS
ncbi:adenosylcobinamide-GDP ribazoletransferase [Moraxella caviae]|uniref:Adenosylcobinamide-GDP ribazoletransferase n=1 Tax=Moraxella caviae TaxID=34060 RepID=A0A1T0ACU1_9GAMM|nr:adenosylcobinamide-GDP ribazoletransferase [Moraxella caviae]